MRLIGRGIFTHMPRQGEPWDGSTRYLGMPSASSAAYVPVVGQGSQHPIGMSWAEVMEIGMRWKLAKANVAISGRLRIYGETTSDYFDFSYPSDSQSAIGERISVGTLTEVQCAYVPEGKEWGFKHALRNASYPGMFGLDTVNTSIEDPIVAEMLTFTTIGKSTVAGDPDSLASVVAALYAFGTVQVKEVLNDVEVSDVEGDEVHGLIFRFGTPILQYDGLFWPAIFVQCDTASSLGGDGAELGGTVSGLTLIGGDAIQLWKSPSIPDQIDDTTIATINIDPVRFHPHDPVDGGGPIWHATSGLRMRAHYLYP